MNKNLDHLTNEQIVSLIERYYNNENISLLLKEYHIDVPASALFKLFPEQITETLCPYCALQMRQKYISKAYSRMRMEDPQCPQCEHKQAGYCYCLNCRNQEYSMSKLLQAKHALKHAEKRNFIFTYLSNIQESRNAIDLESISFPHKIYLGALLREGISEDFNYIHPIETFTNPLAPTIDYQREIASELYRAKIIIVHPNSDYSAFLADDTAPNGFRLNSFKVKWLLNVSHGNLNKVPLINSIINPTTIPDSQEAYLLWRKIALHESIEYLLYNTQNVMGIDYVVGDKTIAVIEDLLTDFSVSQIYNFIYGTTNSALRFQKEQGVSMIHAANTIIGRAQRYAERAKVEEWDIKQYSRQKECPESALSQFFFERILKIGYDGFDRTPYLLI